MINQILGVAILGALGSLFRFWSSENLNGLLPYGTLFSNLTGCFILGFILKFPVNDSWKTIIIVGFCGGLTTFSSFIYQLQELWNGREWSNLSLYFCLSLILGIVALILGTKISSLLNFS